MTQLLSRLTLIVGLGVSAGLLVTPGQVRAGPPEIVRDVLVRDGQPDDMMMLYEFANGGLLRSDDAGESWQILCNQAIRGDAVGEATSWAYTPDGVLYEGYFGITRQSSDRLCTWSDVPELDGRWITAFQTHPSDPEVLFGISGDTGGADNSLFRRSVADGTWVELGKPFTGGVGELAVAELDGGGLRFYQRAFEVEEKLVESPGVDGGVPVLFPSDRVRWSDDEGASWEEIVFGDPAPAKLKLEAVDPNDPDRIVLSLTENIGALGEFVLKGKLSIYGDQGATLIEQVDVTALGGVAYGSDGTLYYGDLVEGLYRWESGKDPELINADLRLRCLRKHPGGDLLYCEKQGAGLVDPATGDAQPLFNMLELSEFVECGQDPPLCETCARDFGDADFCHPTHYSDAPICQTCGIEVFCVQDCETPDTGVEPPPDGGVDGGEVTPPKKKKKDSGCAVDGLAAGSSPGLPLAGIAVVVLVVAIGNRRRRQRP